MTINGSPAGTLIEVAASQLQDVGFKLIGTYRCNIAIEAWDGQDWSEPLTIAYGPAFAHP